MKRILMACSVLVLCFSACNKEVAKPLTKVQIQQAIDSLASERIKYIDEQARIELEYRLKIEVKVKVDSAVQAISQLKAADTAKKTAISPKDSL